MTFHMLVLERGSGHSEMVLVTLDGHEVLTRQDRRLAKPERQVPDGWGSREADRSAWR